MTIIEQTAAGKFLSFRLKCMRLRLDELLLLRDRRGDRFLDDDRPERDDDRRSGGIISSGAQTVGSARGSDVHALSSVDCVFAGLGATRTGSARIDRDGIVFGYSLEPLMML